MRIIIALLIVSTLLLASCSSERNEEGYVDFRTGTRGLEMKFVDDRMSHTVYEHDILSFGLELFNRGTAPIYNGRLFITGFDPLIINNEGGAYSPGNLPAYGSAREFTIEQAKTQFNIEGGYMFEEFHSGEIFLPYGTSRYNFDMVVYACYPYETIASTSVCVDPQPHRRYVDKPCVTMDVPMGGGQGAPVAVTYVDVENMQNQLRLTFTLSDVGGGTIVDLYSLSQRCPTSFTPSDINWVDVVEVTLGGIPLSDCSPSDNRVKLYNGYGKFTCTAPIGGTTAYESPVEVTLQYGYKSHIRRNFEVIGYD